MSLEYKYFTRELANKEALQNFIDDEMNRPDSLDEIISVILQADGTFLAVGRSKRQNREGRGERGVSAQREHERFQGGTNFPEPPPGGPRHNRFQRHKDFQHKHQGNQGNHGNHQGNHGNHQHKHQGNHQGNQRPHKQGGQPKLPQDGGEEQSS